jgi:hypothetical protein
MPEPDDDPLHHRRRSTRCSGFLAVWPLDLDLVTVGIRWWYGRRLL